MLEKHNCVISYRFTWNAEMFSMSRKAGPEVLNLVMAPGEILFMSWHRTTPFFRTFRDRGK